jgi:hypothetical protein
MSIVAELRWKGPYVFFPQQNRLPVVFDAPEAAEPGLYLWTIESPDGYLVNYVGEAGRGTSRIGSRLAEGIEYYLCGGGEHNEGSKYVQGIREPYGFTLVDFMKELPRHTKEIYEVLLATRVFIAPIRCETDDVRKRVEAAVIRAIIKHSDRAKHFLSNKRWRNPCYPAITVHSSSPTVLIGIPDIFEE